MQILDTLSTPGIITQIALKLHWTDKSFKGLFRLINTKRYHHELQPFIDRYIHIKKTKQERMKYHKDKRKLEIYMLKIKPILEKDIRKMVDIIQCCEGHFYKFIAMNAFLHYIVDNKKYLKVLGKRLGISIQNKLAEAISDLESLEMFEERDMVIEHRNNLDAYLIWANHTT